MGMLDTMCYVNVRHELPQIGIRQQQAMTERATFRPAQMSRDYQAPLADVAATLVTIDIDTYESRKTYGFLNNTDFAKKYGGKGQADNSAHTSAKAQSNWSFIMQGGQPGHDEIVAQAKSKLMGEIMSWPTWQSIIPPEAQITVHPSEIVGQIDPGSDKMKINSTADADIEIRTGKAETYLAKEGSIRMWATEGYIDVYA